MQNQIMQIIAGSVAEVFPRQDPSELVPGMRLGEIKGWDSMNAVNLQIELEARLNRGLLDFAVTEDLTVADLAGRLAAHK
jgi:acyl carrier protein